MKIKHLSRKAYELLKMQEIGCFVILRNRKETLQTHTMPIT